MEGEEVNERVDVPCPSLCTCLPKIKASNEPDRCIASRYLVSPSTSGRKTLHCSSSSNCHQLR